MLFNNFDAALGKLQNILKSKNFLKLLKIYLVGIYLLKVNNRNTRTRCEICSKLTIKTTSGDFIVNFEHISHIVLVFLMITLNV